MAAQLIQDDLTSTKKAGEAASLKCTGFDLCDNNYMYWYMKKDPGTFTVIVRFDRIEKKISKFTHPLKESFSAMSDKDDIVLLINKCSLEHSATYYCVCHKEVPHSEK
uniref:Ig-like domain-containing protein n=1 Tax=Oreochromis aureus TaxID=47969 RepID=A0A668RRH5_OREAU